MPSCWFIASFYKGKERISHKEFFTRDSTASEILHWVGTTFEFELTSRLLKKYEYGWYEWNSDVPHSPHYCHMTYNSISWVTSLPFMMGKRMLTSESAKLVGHPGTFHPLCFKYYVFRDTALLMLCFSHTT